MPRAVKNLVQRSSLSEPKYFICFVFPKYRPILKCFCLRFFLGLSQKRKMDFFALLNSAKISPPPQNPTLYAFLFHVSQGKMTICWIFSGAPFCICGNRGIYAPIPFPVRFVANIFHFSPVYFFW